MAHTTLFSAPGHANVLIEDYNTGGLAVQANQHVIVHGDSGMILDPGGHKVYSKVLAATLSVLGRANATHQVSLLPFRIPVIPTPARYPHSSFAAARAATITADCRAGVRSAHRAFQLPRVPDGDSCTIARYGSNRD